MASNHENMAQLEDERIREILKPQGGDASKLSAEAEKQRAEALERHKTQSLGTWVVLAVLITLIFAAVNYLLGS